MIGNDVSIAHRVSIISVSHTFDEPGIPIRDQAIAKMPVTIGNNVWIGAGACVLGGVRISDNVVIGANAVVTRSIEEVGVYAGVPARLIGPLPEMTKGSSHSISTT